MLKAIFAGICIGIAGWGFLVDKTLGMFLFIFGLATVVSYEAKLYTGVSGFCASLSDLKQLFGVILPGNIVGCLLVALMTCFTKLPVHDAASSVLESHDKCCSFCQKREGVWILGAPVVCSAIVHPLWFSSLYRRCVLLSDSR